MTPEQTWQPMLPVFILAGLAFLLIIILYLGALLHVPALRYRFRARISMPNSIARVASMSRTLAPMVKGATERKNEQVRRLEPERVSELEAADEDNIDDEDGDSDDGDLRA